MSSRHVFLRAAVCFLLLGSSASAQNDPEHSVFSAVLRDHVVKGEVDYGSIKTDKRFTQYLSAISETDPITIKDENDRLAFWINAYNAFTIRLIVDHYPVKSIRDIKQGNVGPWDVVWIEIGGKTYSLTQIEHNIIRKQFNEPRIHMALVCAAKSCPPLRSEAYIGKQLDAQLDDNARAFLHDESKNRFDSKTKTLYVSELFKWYGDDFKAKYGSAQAFIISALNITGVQSTEYVSYDWNLNERH